MRDGAKKILIIDDDPALAEILVLKLEEEGFVALQAENGRQGYSQAVYHRPDLILLDILMPEMNGLEMLAKLRGHHWGKTAAVMVLTNLNSEEKLAEALGMAVFDYLIKAEYQLDQIVVKIKERLAD